MNFQSASKEDPTDMEMSLEETDTLSDTESKEAEDETDQCRQEVHQEIKDHRAKEEAYEDVP